MSERKNPIKLAAEFMALNPDEFRMFWAAVGVEWNDENSDPEAMWFYFGENMRPLEVAVIRALYMAVMSGQKAREKKA